MKLTKKERRRRERAAREALKLVRNAETWRSIAEQDEAHRALVRSRVAEYVDSQRLLGVPDEAVIVDEENMLSAYLHLVAVEHSAEGIVGTDLAEERRDAIALLLSRWRTDFSLFQVVLFDYVRDSSMTEAVVLDAE